MQRFFFLLMAFLLTANLAVAEPYTPPVTGDMVGIKLFDEPKAMPEIVLAGETGNDYLSNYKGKLVVLNLWATWCPPCVKELPSLNALQTALGPDKIKILAVSIDTTGIDSVKKYLGDMKMDQLTPLIDIDQAIQRTDAMKGIRGVPSTLIIDPQMRAVARFDGEADWNGPAARALIEGYASNVSFLPYKLNKMY